MFNCYLIFSLVVFVFPSVLSLYSLENRGCDPEVVIEETLPEVRTKGGGEFLMLFRNFPREVEITMVYARLVQECSDEFQEVERFEIDSAGKLWIKGKHVAFYTFEAQGIAKGEKVRYRYLNPEGQMIAESSFIPYPLIIHSKNRSFSIEIELLQLEPMAYSLTYRGLNNGERMRLRSCSSGETVEEDFFYRSNTPTIYIPAVVGLKGGYALLDITRLAGDLLKVKLPWGVEIQSKDEKQKVNEKRKVQRNISKG